MREVVLADDDLMFRAWLESVLEQGGDLHVVGEANDGETALELVETLHPDVVIADVYMRDMDGLEVARRIKHSHPKIDSILVSAHSDRTHERLAVEEGALALIPKQRVSAEAVRHALKKAV